jgi:hypothetical protein
MTARVLLCTIVVEVALFFVLARSPTSAAAHSVRRAPKVDVPWLSHEAAAQLIGPDGAPGPLFEGLDLGGPPPSPVERRRIAAFARANGIAIDLDIADDELAAIRLDVTFGGCCGYEGADVLALRLHRPTRGANDCMVPEWWPNDWVFSSGDAYARVALRFGRVTVRWEAPWSFAEMLARADSLLGTQVADVSAASHGHWITAAPGRYLLEVPYVFDGYAFADPLPVAERDDLGLMITAEHGQIVEVAFRVNIDWHSELDERWGSAHEVDDDDGWTWRVPGRVVHQPYDWTERTTIRLAPGRGHTPRTSR